MEVSGAGGIASAGADVTGAGRFADDDVGRLADVAGAGRLVGADAGGFAGGVSFADEGSDDDAGEEDEKAAAVDDTGDDARVRE